MDNKLKIAFVVGNFPAVSETFIIDQIADLIDRGIEVDIFSFDSRRPSLLGISDRFRKYGMASNTHYVGMPLGKVEKVLKVVPKVLRLLFLNPRILREAINGKKYVGARSLRYIYWISPFLNKKYDLYHCHFGTMANRFITIRDILGIDDRFVTSFYGYDVSRIIKEKGIGVYDRLKKESSRFIVMSENMKERVLRVGFSADKIVVNPIGINLEDYSYHQHKLEDDEGVKIISVGRFVEKKGFDDLLRAMSIAKDRTKRRLRLTIVGDGPKKEEIMQMTKDLNLGDMIDYRGYMEIGKVMDLFGKMDFFVQPSKTAKDGDME